MSNFYLDIVKDRLYVLEKDAPSRRAVQTVLAETLKTLTLLIAPVLSFTAEEVWSYIPFKEKESVLLNAWPELPDCYENEELAARWELLLHLREESNKALEAARREKLIGSSLQAAVELYPDEELYPKLAAYSTLLPALLIVSSCRLHEPGTKLPADGLTTAQELNLRLKIQGRQAKMPALLDVFSDSWPKQEHEEVCSRCQEILDRNRPAAGQDN